MRDAVAHKIWQFWPDGRARRRETIASQPQAWLTEYDDVDPSSHWLPAPTFGDWDRWGKPLDQMVGGEDMQ